MFIYIYRFIKKPDDRGTSIMGKWGYEVMGLWKIEVMIIVLFNAD
jgi:hypothetical protein